MQRKKYLQELTNNLKHVNMHAHILNLVYPQMCMWLCVLNFCLASVWVFVHDHICIGMLTFMGIRIYVCMCMCVCILACYVIHMTFLCYVHIEKTHDHAMHGLHDTKCTYFYCCKLSHYYKICKLHKFFIESLKIVPYGTVAFCTKF